MLTRVIEVGIIILCFFAFVFFTIVLIKSEKKEKKSTFEKRKEELSNMIDNFVNCYNKFEEYLDKDIQRKQFISELKRKGLISSSYVTIPMGKNGKMILAYSTDSLREFLFSSGELILYNGEEYYRLYRIRIENLEEYGEFIAKYENLKKIYSDFEKEKNKN